MWGMALMRMAPLPIMPAPLLYKSTVSCKVSATKAQWAAKFQQQKRSELQTFSNKSAVSCKLSAIAVTDATIEMFAPWPGTWKFFFDTSIPYTYSTLYQYLFIYSIYNQTYQAYMTYHFPSVRPCGFKTAMGVFWKNTQPSMFVLGEFVNAKKKPKCSIPKRSLPFVGNKVKKCWDGIEFARRPPLTSTCVHELQPQRLHDAKKNSEPMGWTHSW